MCEIASNNSMLGLSLQLSIKAANLIGVQQGASLIKDRIHVLSTVDPRNRRLSVPDHTKHGIHVSHSSDDARKTINNQVKSCAK